MPLTWGPRWQLISTLHTILIKFFFCFCSCAHGYTFIFIYITYHKRRGSSRNRRVSTAPLMTMIICKLKLILNYVLRVVFNVSHKKWARKSVKMIKFNLRIGRLSMEICTIFLIHYLNRLLHFSILTSYSLYYKIQIF